MALAPSIQSRVVLSFIPSTANANSQFNTGGLWRQPTFQFKVFSNGLRTNNYWPKAGVKPRKIPLQCYASYGPSSSGALTPEMKSSLEKFITSNKVVLFMKGTKDFPQCGFSNTVVQILNNLNVPFETFNILENDLLRQGLKEYSNWPTFPQLYIDGEFFGGCDITTEAYKSGELQEIVDKAMCS